MAAVVADDLVGVGGAVDGGVVVVAIPIGSKLSADEDRLGEI